MEVELKKWQFINITNLKLLAASLAGLIIVATVNNLIPFIVAPTFGQVLWTSSFAQSYINGGWPSIYATNIGIPNPQPISYGLVGPFLQSAISVLLDISMVNSYTIAQLILIAAAFYGCVKFAGLFLKNHYFAIISAVVFLSLPIVWFHQSFGTLAIGFASMPGYFFVIIHFLESLREPQNSRTAKIINGFILILVALFSVFIDGYTFVMFAISAGILGIIYWLKYRKGSLFAGGVYIALVFAASYYLYDLFILDMSFQKEGVTFFNAWGIDLVMLFAPIKSVSAALDRFGLSIPIDTKRFYGDATVWRSSFILPLLIPAIFGFFIKKDRKPLYTILLIIGLIGLYFSLGPWLKVNSLRPIDQHGEITYTLPIPPSPVGIFPTGSSFINTSVPGFNSMRATYRWIILTYVFLFASASVLLDSLIRRKKYLIALVGILLVFIVSIPDPIQQFEVGKSSLQRFYQLDQTIKELRPLLEGKKVLFLPLGNDFLQGYISSQTNAYSYNIGGDKNVIYASNSWPEAVKRFYFKKINACSSTDISILLLDHPETVIVFPLSAKWPPSKSDISTNQPKLDLLLSDFSSDPAYTITKSDLFYFLERNPAYDPITITTPYSLDIFEKVAIADNACETPYILSDGWYASEQTHVWSQGSASLSISPDDQCSQTKCYLRLTGSVFNATLAHPQTITYTVNGQAGVPIKVSDPSIHQLDIPLSSSSVQESDIITITIGDPASPRSLGISNDERVLGLSLVSIELIKSRIKR